MTPNKYKFDLSGAATIAFICKALKENGHDGVILPLHNGILTNIRDLRRAMQILETHRGLFRLIPAKKRAKLIGCFNLVCKTGSAR